MFEFVFAVNLGLQAQVRLNSSFYFGSVPRRARPMCLTLVTTSSSINNNLVSFFCQIFSLAITGGVCGFCLNRWLNLLRSRGYCWLGSFLQAEKLLRRTFPRVLSDVTIVKCELTIYEWIFTHAAKHRSFSLGHRLLAYLMNALFQDIDQRRGRISCTGVYGSDGRACQPRR